MKTNIVLEYIKFAPVSVTGFVITMFVSSSLYNHVIYIKKYYSLTGFIGIM